MGKINNNKYLIKMKAFALAMLLGVAVADVPVSVGFLQTSACHTSGVAGVNCLPNAELFATGMNGDEDLAEDITMKGDKFHYVQKPS